MKQCLRCGAEHNRRSNYCSDACSLAARNERNHKARKADFASNVEHLPLMSFLLDVCERQQSIAAALHTDLPALNNMLNRCRYQSWASGIPLELSHYKSVKAGGVTDISNLGIWPRFLNRSFGSQSLPIGKRFSEAYLKKTRCSSKAEALRKLSANVSFVTRFKALLHAPHDDIDPFNNIAKPRRYDDWKRLQKAGYKGSLTKVRSLSKVDMLALLERHDLKPALKPEPSEQQQIALVTILSEEYARQCKVSPYHEILFADLGVTGDVLRDNVPERFREQLLFAALLHNYEEVENLMKDYVPNKPVTVIAHRGDGYASEVHTWKGDDSKWHQTDLPTNPANLYRSYEKQYGEAFPF